MIVKKIVQIELDATEKSDFARAETDLQAIKSMADMIEDREHYAELWQVADNALVALRELVNYIEDANDNARLDS